MIRSFKCRETEKIFGGEASTKFPSNIQARIMTKLQLLNAAGNVNALRIPPGNRLEALKGNRKGQHSIRLNNQWRICFVWKNDEAHNVEVVDYHG